MELYILDAQLRRIQVIDVFNSLIWTERFNDVGDFQLVIESNSEYRNLFVPDTLIACNTSYRVMKVENADDAVDENGASKFTVTGPSLEIIMNDRVAKNTMGNLTTDPAWVITDTPANIMRTVFKHICIDGALDVDDKIPYITTGTFLISVGSWAALPATLYWNAAVGEWATAYTATAPAGSSDTATAITVSLTPDTVLSVIQQIAKAYNIGFRLVRNYDTSQLYFEVYEGIDRTSTQTAVEAVLFSPSMDNLTNTRELRSSAGSKNTALVFAPNGVVTVYAEDEKTGFERKVIHVDASDITDAAGAGLTTKLTQRGVEALATHRNLTAFEGEVSQWGWQKYGINYDLGDLVELKNKDNVFSKVRVTEQIMVHDEQGERGYPTLVTENVVDPGSWGAVPSTLHWVDATGYWADQ